MLAFFKSVSCILGLNDEIVTVRSQYVLALHLSYQQILTLLEVVSILGFTLCNCRKRFVE